MNKEEFGHAIRAAGSIINESNALVIGSQAAHGSIRGELPPEAMRSIEGDVSMWKNGRRGCGKGVVKDVGKRHSVV